MEVFEGRSSLGGSGTVPNDWGGPVVVTCDQSQSRGIHLEVRNRQIWAVALAWGAYIRMVDHRILERQVPILYKEIVVVGAYMEVARTSQTVQLAYSFATDPTCFHHLAVLAAVECKVPLRRCHPQYWTMAAAFRLTISEILLYPFFICNMLS